MLKEGPRQYQNFQKRCNQWHNLGDKDQVKPLSWTKGSVKVVIFYQAESLVRTIPKIRAIQIHYLRHKGQSGLQVKKVGWGVHSWHNLGDEDHKKQISGNKGRLKLLFNDIAIILELRTCQSHEDPSETWRPVKNIILEIKTNELSWKLRAVRANFVTCWSVGVIIPKMSTYA